MSTNNSTWDGTEESMRKGSFSFHPDILGEAGELPRRTDGSEYTAPEQNEQSPAAAQGDADEGPAGRR